MTESNHGPVLSLIRLNLEREPSDVREHVHHLPEESLLVELEYL